ncbi:MAG: stage III sporulation protein AD [Clostridia bacterium]|nr:stage III sporulation protein AD [Clostridia bacterium]
MDVFKIVAFAIIAVSIILVIKEQRKEIALMLSIVAGVSILLFSITKISPVMDMLNELVTNSGINSQFLLIILKVTGIAYIVEFGKNICVDAGESAIGTKLEMAGKVIILTLSIPLIGALMNILTNLI